MQGLIVRYMARFYRLRLLYGLHLSLYGLALGVLVFSALHTGTKIEPLGDLLIAWLPILLAHNVFQVYIEAREWSLRCSLERNLLYAPAEQEKFQPFDRPVDFYDEDGNLIRGDNLSIGGGKIDFFPFQRDSDS